MGMFGETEEERRIRERAEARQKQYEAETGEKVPEEAGIEEDTTLEDMALTMLGPGGALKKAGQFAVGQAKGAAKKGLLSKVEMPAAPDKSKSIGGMGYSTGEPAPVQSPWKQHNELGQRLPPGTGKKVTGKGIIWKD